MFSVKNSKRTGAIKRVAPKKATPKKPVVTRKTVSGVDEVLTQKQLEEMLPEKWSIEGPIDEMGWSLEREEGKSRYSYTSDVQTLSWNKEATQFCCGMDEIGDISLDLGDEDDSITDRMRIEFTKASLMEAYNENIKGKRKRLIMLNLIDSDDCNVVKRAIEELPSYFELVRTFQNMNSGNTIETYLSL